MLPMMDDKKPKASIIVGMSHSGPEEKEGDDKMLDDAAGAIVTAMQRGDKQLLAYALKTFIKLCDNDYKSDDDDDDEGDYKRSMF